MVSKKQIIVYKGDLVILESGTIIFCNSVTNDRRFFRGLVISASALRGRIVGGWGIGNIKEVYRNKDIAQVIRFLEKN